MDTNFELAVDTSPPSPKAVIPYRLAPGVCLTTEDLYRVAREAGWSLHVPAGAPVAPDWLDQTTLGADTYTGTVIFRKKAGTDNWTMFERDTGNEFAVAEQFIKMGIRFDFDPERCTLYH